MKRTLCYSILLLCLFSTCLNAPKKDAIQIKKWVAIGNSITKHPINSYWWGEYGMAASSKEKDFVHVLNKKLTEINDNVNFKIASAVDWEQNHNNYDLSYFDSFFDGDENLVVVRIGENVTSIENYEINFRKLIQYIKKLAPNAQIIITGIFMTESVYLDQKDKIQKETAELENCIYVSLKELAKEENRNFVGAEVMGDDNLLHKIDNKTVADHPGDKGMAAIASKIFEAIYD